MHLAACSAREKALRQNFIALTRLPGEHLALIHAVGLHTRQLVLVPGPLVVLDDILDRSPQLRPGTLRGTFLDNSPYLRTLEACCPPCTADFSACTGESVLLGVPMGLSSIHWVVCWGLLRLFAATEAGSGLVGCLHLQQRGDPRAC